MLQVGGVQEATTAVVPGWEMVMVPMPVVVLPLAVPAFGADELQVKGTPVMELLLASITVGVTVSGHVIARIDHLDLVTRCRQLAGDDCAAKAGAND